MPRYYLLPSSTPENLKEEQSKFEKFLTEEKEIKRKYIENKKNH
jgi:hypothetical protein